MDGLQRTIHLTEDGSHTIALSDKRLTYHSIHGAIGESRYVFIETGLQPVLKKSGGLPINILEMGFGTGLNALLTLKEAIRKEIPVYYEGIELHPLVPSETAGLNYTHQLGDISTDAEFYLLHAARWNEHVPLHPFFTLHKRQVSMTEAEYEQRFHLIYYDAFAPKDQPELWTRDIFEKLHRNLYPGGILVTFCSKGAVRRAMLAAGFRVEKLPGPPGKREILRATRPATA